MSSDEKSKLETQDVKFIHDTTCQNFKNNSKTEEDIDRTAVAKPPDINWTVIIVLVVTCVLIMLYGDVRRK